MQDPRLTVHCFPSSDLAFRRTAETLVGLADEAVGSADARVAFEARLRREYPEARVRDRDPLAALGADRVWYVFRDSSHPARTPWRVLVVEDDRAMARMIAAAMVSEGAEVRSAADGKVALELTWLWEPDAIVLDLGLPELDGPGFAAEYRRRRGKGPIVVVSGAPDAFATSEQIGARAWLPKPFDLDELIDLVRPAADRMQVPQG